MVLVYPLSLLFSTVSMWVLKINFAISNSYPAQKENNVLGVYFYAGFLLVCFFFDLFLYDG